MLSQPRPRLAPACSGPLPGRALPVLEVTAMPGKAPMTPAPPSVDTLPIELDEADAYAVPELLTAKIAPGVVVIADMTSTTFCDSAGVGALVRAWQRSNALDCDLRLLALPGIPCAADLRASRPG